MARSLRLEIENGVYHVINRGNYRQNLFVDEGTHQSFEKCLFEACEKCGWVLEGFCVMSNHFHLVVRTPQGNLIYGMKWLQSTFANRYHRFRKINGKLFQGRYKSLIVEESAYLGALLHYVHLNPARARMCSALELKGYRWSSYWYLHHPSKRPGFLRCEAALESAGGLADTPHGRRKYHDYLGWVAAETSVQKDLEFEKMSRGWALGTKAFKQALLKKAMGEADSKEDKIRFEGEDLKEANELMWDDLLSRALGVLGKSGESIQSDRKSAEWKVTIACLLKRRSSAPNPWIARHLNMGIPQGVSLHVSRFRAAGKEDQPMFQELVQILTE